MAERDETGAHLRSGGLLAHQALHIKSIAGGEEWILGHPAISHRLGTTRHHLSGEQAWRLGHVGIEARQLAVENAVQQGIGAVVEGRRRNAVVEDPPGQLLLIRLEIG